MTAIGLKTLSAEIAADDGHAWAVFCNIAMPIMDTCFDLRKTRHANHQMANEAAAHLMQHLFGYDITKHELYEYGKSGAQSYAEMRIAADKAEDTAPAATPAHYGGAIEALAQFLHDEGGFGDAMTDRTWPDHADDTGQREGGWVKIVPADVQAHFRDVARRWLGSRLVAAPIPAGIEGRG